MFWYGMSGEGDWRVINNPIFVHAPPLPTPIPPNYLYFSSSGVVEDDDNDDETTNKTTNKGQDAICEYNASNFAKTIFS